MKNQKGITIVSLIVTIIVMVILAGIALLFSVGEEGVISKANQAEETTNLAQVIEKAQVVKASLALDIATEDSENIVVIQEFLKRLKKELDGRIEGNRVITKGDEYAVTLKGVDLEVDVSKYSNDIFDPTIFFTPIYQISGTTGKISGTMMNIDLNKILENVQNMAENATMAEKEKRTIEYLTTLDGGQVYRGFDKLDDIVVKGLKAEFPGINHNKLEDWVNDPNVRAYANQNMQSILKGEELKADHFYLYAFHSTKDDMITYGYEGYLNYCILKPIGNVYNSKNLTIEIKKDNITMVSDTFNISSGYEIENITKGIYDICISAGNLTLINERIIINKTDN